MNEQKEDALLSTPAARLPPERARGQRSQGNHGDAPR
jgi:hypothetical protein